jgi:hypothetical protein
MKSQKDKFEPKSLKHVLTDFISQKPLKKGVLQIRVCNAWPEVMGKHIASYTDEVRFSNSTLYVTLRSAPLKNELLYGLGDIVERINTHLGGVFVQKITLV